MENDTVLAISKEQLIAINRHLNHLDRLEVELDIKNKELALSDSVNDELRKIIFKEDAINRLNEERFVQFQNENSQLKQSIDEMKKRNRRTLISVGVGGTLIGVLIGLFLN